MRCYWEDFEEQIGNSGNMLGSLVAIEWALENLVGTHWEFFIG
jgi:hypothetical protein